MMKLKRLVASMLALLLMVSLLPMAAMADDLPDNTVSQVPINEPIGTNSGNAVDIGENGSVQTNKGSIEENKGTVVTNNGKIVENKKTVENNNKVVETNGTQNGGAESGTIQSNNGTVGEEGNNASGNYGTIYINKSGGNVLINQEGGVVDVNQKGGTIETNKGIVGAQNQFGVAEPSSGNFGTVETNNGKVLINQAGGTVETNAAGGIVETNKNGGTIDTNYGLVGKQIGNQFVTDDETGNFGTVTTNYGIITQNKNLVVTNGKIGNADGYICKNDGTVKNNETRVWDNNGMVETNNGSVENNNKNGTMVTNNGFVTKNSGEVVTNNRVIETNSGIVETNNRYIGNNYGTVNTNNIDGTVHNSNTETLDDVVGTNFGLVNNCDVDKKIYYGLSWGDSVNSLNKIESFVKEGDERNLDKIASGVTRDGYKMTGYKAYERMGGKDSQITGDTTKYLMNAPVWLQILWEKIVTAVAPAASNEPEAKPVKAAAIPSTVKAEDVKVGTVVRVKGQLFRVIEMDDGSMTVITMGKLSKKDMEDLMAFLSKYFTPEQIELLLGDPELISEELAEKLFGGNTGHIVFKAEKNLFA